MNVSMIVAPLVGAAIGYCTNYIAVKMLFRPLRPKYLFGKQLPFTPGIIPKSKDRIAGAIGQAVGENLLTQDALEKSLLSEELTEKIKGKINSKIVELMDDEKSLRETATFYMEETQYEELASMGENFISDKVCEKVCDMNLGDLIAHEVAEVAMESAGGFMAMFINDSMINSLMGPLSNKIDEMVKTKGTQIIREKIHEEYTNLSEKSIGEIVTTLTDSGINVGKLVTEVYIIIIKKRLGSMLRGINITQIVQDKIDSMEIEEVEEMVLGVMKKELNAIVNLGALIGFILGCINIFF